MAVLIYHVSYLCYTGDFQAQDIVQDLNRLLDIGPDRNASMLCEIYCILIGWTIIMCVFSLAEIDQSHAMSCLSALIRYLEVNNYVLLLWTNKGHY